MTYAYFCTVDKVTFTPFSWAISEFNHHKTHWKILHIISLQYILIHWAKKPLSTTKPIIEVKGHHNRWLAGGYDMEIGHF